VPDFPEPGVLFRDLTPLFVNPEGFAAVVDAMVGMLDPGVELLAAVEARGFLLAAAIGYAKGIGVVPVRKPGKLPSVAGRVDFALEYGTASLELPAGVMRAGQRVVVIDDVLATGGTVKAVCQLVEDAGAEVDSVLVVIELKALGARSALSGRKLHTLQVC
jgi:adenine phosphoribosyltransferase